MEQKKEKATKDRPEAAAFLGISVPTLDRISDKDIARSRIGRRVLYTEESLREYLARKTQQPNN